MWVGWAGVLPGGQEELSKGQLWLSGSHSQLWSGGCVLLGGGLGSLGAQALALPCPSHLSQQAPRYTGPQAQGRAHPQLLGRRFWAPQAVLPFPSAVRGRDAPGHSASLLGRQLRRSADKPEAPDCSSAEAGDGSPGCWGLACKGQEALTL